jgi:beta-galactosidase
LLPAANGIDKPDEVKKLIRDNHKGKGPFYIAEWYPAWFDWWGTKHHTVPAEKYATGLDAVLAAGISINMYMFHGGTTRDFMNGANCNDKNPYEPQISSYDYDAPLDEAGNATPKFMKFREVISKYLPSGMELPEVPAAKPVIKIPSINFTQTTSLFDILPVPVKNTRPLSFEDLGQDYGFVLYRTTLTKAVSGILSIKDLRDYGIIFVNGKRVGILDRRLKQDSIAIDIPAGKVTLDILVENLGRINYGPYLLKNKKGITEKVTLAGKELTNWQMFSLPFKNINTIVPKNKKPALTAPVIKSATFNTATIADTYLDMSGWGKGVAWVNGHNLGRYWEIGPQQTLYVPAEWLKKGANKIVILELIKPEQNILLSTDKSELNTLH